MKKIIAFILLLCANVGGVVAQEMAEEQGGHEHAISFAKPHALAANLIVWISVAVVVLTLILTLKYLFKPRENNPNHIKNIVRDEGF